MEQSFIEVQFPISKVSKESYKERKANLGQTLTGLGKWWGRKPLVLVRAALLGLLLPATDNPRKDREIFLRLMMMDEAGMKQRRAKNPTAVDIYEALTEREQKEYFTAEMKPRWKKGVTKEKKQAAIELAWHRFSYDKKLTYCLRPEEIAALPEGSWEEINAHLGTHAASLPELVEQLGTRWFGHRAVVGDCFCGGGSVPFEAARIGNDVVASDLNPIAGLLTWADLHIAGASDEEVANLRTFQQRVYDAVNQQIQAWGIETNEAGDRANSYLYCNEIICPECGWRVPLAPSWVIGKGTKTVALLKDNGQDGFIIEIRSGVTAAALAAAEKLATVRETNVYCPHCQRLVPISAIRHDTSAGSGLRLWEKEEFLPRQEDVFQERLYCIKYEHTEIDSDGKVTKTRYYQAPTAADEQREAKVRQLLAERFAEWQRKGYIPAGEIAEGYNTSQVIRERGWKYWHQLFNARQLLVHGLFLKELFLVNDVSDIVTGLLGIHKLADWDSKLARWDSAASSEKVAETFSNQALNTIYNFPAKGICALSTSWFYNIKNTINRNIRTMKLCDARSVEFISDFWITDPPYADAVNYHELSEFFLAWDKALLKKAFSDWYTDSKRVLAVRGRDETFNQAMVAIYQNLAAHMPDNGRQIIMFTHQDVSVWADLALVVWSAGLQVTAAWNIATETDASGLKNGNYVKGTVLLVLRKQQGDATAFLDELYPDIEAEVKRQIASMRALDDKEEPNFTDADYILAAYAAALQVLTSVKRIEDIDVDYELRCVRPKGELSPVAKLIENATKIAYDQLIPTEFDNFIWRLLTPEERFYIKGLEVEKNGIYQVSSYQELARGFGVVAYKELMQNTHANTARLRTGKEWARRSQGGAFAGSLLRQVLMALYIATKGDAAPAAGRDYLKSEVEDYWNKRSELVELLSYIAGFQAIGNMGHWQAEAAAARVLRELVANDGI